MRLTSGLSRRPCASLLAPIFLWIALLCSDAGSQEGQDPIAPMDLWMRGVLLVQASGDDEAKGKYLEALNKLSEAQPIFDHLAQNNPDLYPELVQARRQLIADKRAELKLAMRQPGTPSIQTPAPNIGAQPAPIAPPPVPNSGSPSATVGIGTMEIESGGEFALPSWNEGASQALPRMDGSHTPGTPRVQAGTSVGAVASSLYDDLKNKDGLISLLIDENQKLRDQVKQREVLLQQINQQLTRAKASQEELLRQKAALEAGGGGVDAQQKIESLKQLLAEATRQLEDATERNQKLVAAMQDSQEEMEKMKVRMAELEREKDNLAEVLRGEGAGGKALKELMDRNRALTERLDRAEQLAASLSELNKEKDNDITLLKKEITKIKFERDQLITENERHQQSIAELQQKLEMLSDGLSPEDKKALANASPVERQENELLRSVVLKQLRRQAQMKQAKELLLEQLDRTGARSDLLIGLVEDMARGSQLSDEEKALFKAPQFEAVLAAAEPGPAPAEDGEPKETPRQSGAVMSATLVAAGTGKPVNADPNRFVEKQKLSVELSQIDKSARLDFKEGRFSEAEAGFLEYLRYMPQSVPCLCNLGVLKISMKNYSEAEYFLEKAIAIDSKSGLAYYLLGRALFLQDKLDSALERLETAINHDPQNAKAHNCVGVISTRKGWVTRAEKAFTSAVSIDPEYGDAHFNLALLHASKEAPDPQEAGKHYFRALDLGIPRDAKIEEFLKQAEEAGVAVGMR